MLSHSQSDLCHIDMRDCYFNPDTLQMRDKKGWICILLPDRYFFTRICKDQIFSTIIQLRFRIYRQINTLSIFSLSCFRDY